MKIRQKLTLIFTAFEALLGLVWAAGMVLGLHVTLENFVEHQAIDKTIEVTDYLKDLASELRASGSTLDLKSFDALPRAFSDDGTYLQVLDRQGHPLNRSPNLGWIQLPPPINSNPNVTGWPPEGGLGRMYNAAALEPDVNVRHVSVALARNMPPSELVLASAPVSLPGIGWVGWIQAARTLTTRDHSVPRFALIAAGSWVLFVALAFGVGYGVTGRALAPVAAMTDDVRQLHASDLHHRIAVPPEPHDEIARLGATFNDLFGRLESAFEAQRQFVADASHEFKTPLTAILGNLRLIKARGTDHPAEVLKWATAAEREAERLARLGEHLLLLARSGESTVPLLQEPVEWVALAREVVANYRVQTPRVNLREAPEAWVLGDHDRLSQVLINLIDNAVRATQAGGEVWVEVSQTDSAVLLAVTDTGVGMAPEVQAHIFDRFYRADEARDRTQGGSGLGLAIVRALVKNHHGTIAVSSKLNQGTRFEVTLPRYFRGRTGRLQAP